MRPCTSGKCEIRYWPPSSLLCWPFPWVLLGADRGQPGLCGGGVTNTILELPKRFDWGVFKFGCRGDPLLVALVGCKTRPYQPILRFWRRFNARPIALHFCSRWMTIQRPETFWKLPDGSTERSTELTPRARRSLSSARSKL